MNTGSVSLSSLKASRKWRTAAHLASFQLSRFAIDLRLRSAVLYVETMKENARHVGCPGSIATVLATEAGQ